MIEKDKASMRFTQTTNEITITHVPQCNNCTRNIDRYSCEKFISKPEKYLRNKEECGFKITQ